jgi:hypothetical protein
LIVDRVEEETDSRRIPRKRAWRRRFGGEIEDEARANASASVSDSPSGYTWVREEDVSDAGSARKEVRSTDLVGP